MPARLCVHAVMRADLNAVLHCCVVGALAEEQQDWTHHA